MYADRKRRKYIVQKSQDKYYVKGYDSGERVQHNGRGQDGTGCTRIHI